jgi:hypothetical protein
MDTRLFQIDPQAGIAYGMYNALKKGEGSFEDFLLHYDSHAVNEEDDNSWLTKLVGEDMSAALGSPELIEAMGSLGVGQLDFLASADYFDTQVSGYKLQLMQEMSKRNIDIPQKELLEKYPLLA